MHDNALLFQLLVPMNLGFFALVFLGLYLFEKRLKFTGWLSLAYSSGVIASLLDIASPYSERPLIDATDAANVFYWSVGIFATLAMTSRFKQPPPWRIITSVSLIAFAGQIYFGYFNYIFEIQEALANLWAAFFVALAANICRQFATRGIDKVVWVLLAAIAVAQLLRVCGIMFFFTDSSAHQLAEIHDAAQLFANAVTANCAALSLLLFAAYDIVHIYRDESVTDPLTNLPNRRGIEAQLEMIERDNGTLQNVGVIICDLDHFKHINDHHGHHIGDDILKSAGQFLMEQAKPFGFAGRLGGEEFIIIVRPDAIDAFRSFASNLCVALRHLRFAQLQEGEELTASFGAAVIAPEENYKQALIRADEALYSAKTKGRDQVVFASKSSKSVDGRMKRLKAA